MLATASSPEVWPVSSQRALLARRTHPAELSSRLTSAIPIGASSNEPRSNPSEIGNEVQSLVATLDSIVETPTIAPSAFRTGENCPLTAILLPSLHSRTVS